MVMRPLYSCDQCGKDIETGDVVHLELRFGDHTAIEHQFCTVNCAKAWMAKAEPTNSL
jgi:hypothetical protein